MILRHINLLHSLIIIEITFVKQRIIKIIRIIANKLLNVNTTTKKYTERQEQIANFANAMGHPVRIAILDLLASQTCCYHGDLSDELPIANSTLSQHLKVLKDAGLIQGEINPPKTKYCINRQNYEIASTLFASFFTDSLSQVFTDSNELICSSRI